MTIWGQRSNEATACQAAAHLQRAQLVTCPLLYALAKGMDLAATEDVPGGGPIAWSDGAVDFAADGDFEFSSKTALPVLIRGRWVTSLTMVGAHAVWIKPPKYPRFLRVRSSPPNRWERGLRGLESSWPPATRPTDGCEPAGAGSGRSRSAPDPIA